METFEQHFGSIVVYNNSVVLPDNFPFSAVPQFLDAIWCLEDRKTDEVVFDLSRCVRAFPNTVLPIAAIAVWFRDADVRTRLILPEDAKLRDRCIRTNWAHLIDPSRFEYTDTDFDRHLAATPFLSADQQRKAVDLIIDRVVSTAGISGSPLNALRWTLNELSGNVLDHAQSTAGGIIQLETMPDRVAICVADLGIGILSSLKTRSTYSHIKYHHEAIQTAVRKGVTRDPDFGQGNGLFGSMQLALAFEGHFSIRSQFGSLSWGAETKLTPTDHKNSFPGTFVDLQMRTDRDVNVGAVITDHSDADYQPFDVYSEVFTDESGDNFVMIMSDEIAGFGSRLAGEKARTKCLNLLQSHSSRPVVIDWNTIPIVASSYADEFLGKLFIRIGPTDFSRRISLRNMSKDVQILIDRAIMQRTAQFMNRY